jgi:hypothetical protein
MIEAPDWSEALRFCQAIARSLLAQRREEQVNKACELIGFPVFRPDNWPAIVMEIEQSLDFG